jgi:hypothetical protein
MEIKHAFSTKIEENIRMEQKMKRESQEEK